MIIESIELEDFMCYSGKNKFEFSEGINVIIGDNGYGKSKLFDAFYWVMYDQIFVPEKREFQKTRLVKSKIVSDKAIFSSKDGIIKCSVRITFHNSKKGAEFKGDQFILVRTYSLEKRNHEIIEDKESELVIMKRELSCGNGKLLKDPEEIERVKSKILPAQMKDYLWFQGEQVESIIDFNKQDSLTRAINILSNITQYDKIMEIAASAAESAQKEYDTEMRKLSKDKNQSEILKADKSKLETDRQRLLNEQIEVRERFSRAEEKCDSLLNKIEDATRVRELKMNLNGIDVNLNEQMNEHSAGESSFHRKLFQRFWILKGTEFLFDSYSKKFSDYEEYKLHKETEEKIKQKIREAEIQNRLPIDVPEPIHVQRMLDEEICLVCDREAKKGSAAWKKIEQLIVQPKKEKISNLPRQDYGSDLKKLYHNGLSLRHSIAAIDSDINETLQAMNRLKIKISELDSSKKRIENEIQNLISISSLSMESADNIISEYSIQNKYAKDCNEKLNELSQKLSHNEIALNSISEKEKSLVTGEIPNWLKVKKDVLNDFDFIANSTRERVFDSLILELKDKANEHYERMTAGNLAARGRINLRKMPDGNYMPEIVDQEGHPLLGSNTSNLILVKLASILAIVSSKGNSANLYTLIADAPTSVFGEDYTIGFCKEVSRVYRQSIILSKEFYKNERLREELLSDPEMRIGNVYIVTPSIIETERTSREQLSTIITLQEKNGTTKKNKRKSSRI